MEDNSEMYENIAGVENFVDAFWNMLQDRHRPSEKSRLGKFHSCALWDVVSLLDTYSSKDSFLRSPVSLLETYWW